MDSSLDRNSLAFFRNGCPRSLQFSVRRRTCLQHDVRLHLSSLHNRNKMYVCCYNGCTLGTSCGQRERMQVFHAGHVESWEAVSVAALFTLSHGSAEEKRLEIHGLEIPSFLSGDGRPLVSRCALVTTYSMHHWKSCLEGLP